MNTAKSTIKKNLAESIGSTPIVQMHSALIPHGKSLFLKMETFNPTFSIKDRTAYALIEAAFNSGALILGGTVIESTSGNLGKSIAMLGAAMGFKAMIVVDPKISPQNLAVYRAFGAEIVMVDTPDEDGGYQKTRIKKVKELLLQIPDAYWPNQYENPVNQEFHYRETALELINSDCQFDTLIGSVSTGGHLSGIAKRLKEVAHPIKIVACDSDGSAIFQPEFKPHLLNGLGLSWRTTNVNMSVLDAYCLVSDAEAFSMCRVLAKTTGFLLGGSSGAIIFSALNQLHMTAMSSALCIIADTGWNYLDQFYSDEWLALKKIVALDREQLLHAMQTVRSVDINESALNNSVFQISGFPSDAI